MKSKSGWKRVNSSNKTGGCLKLPSVNSSPMMVQQDQIWSGFTPGMMGYKNQVVALAIALPIHRKNEKGGWSTIGFHWFLWPHTATYGG
ncbi:S2-RNase [Pyrus ussuriensis x Pyrus communis]|uniref:S2-RNase n=1 Tax=Pyrus ussuriensis x Pyrus communis TaxID=2448454 RepID=A0A5N5H5T3_9ROSA|nr:S2-RNase [Pyrus ussuriensis x Pyrus communis]